jgi:putative resolvase
VKLSEWARRNGVHYQTAWQWAREGKMPVPVVRTATGRYMVVDEEVEEKPQVNTGRTVAYCRVSSAEKAPELERQAARVVAAAGGLGMTVSEVVVEIGSAVDGERPKLARLLRDASVGVIVVEHHDRLLRFGLEPLSAALEATGRRIVAVGAPEVEKRGARFDDELVRDMAEVLTSFCARLYGPSSGARRARAALKAALEAA